MNSENNVQGNLESAVFSWDESLSRLAEKLMPAMREYITLNQLQVRAGMKASFIDYENWRPVFREKVIAAIWDTAQTDPETKQVIDRAYIFFGGGDPEVVGVNGNDIDALPERFISALVEKIERLAMADAETAKYLKGLVSGNGLSSIGFRLEWFEAVRDFSDEITGDFFRGVFNYAFFDLFPKFHTKEARALFEVVKTQIDEEQDREQKRMSRLDYYYDRKNKDEKDGEENQTKQTRKRKGGEQ